MRVYISGPMAGIENFNHKRFDEAAELLVERGYQVVNPADLDRTLGLPQSDVGGPWDVTAELRAWCLKGDIRQLVDCDAIVLLDGWEDSQGANIELLVARAIGLDVLRLHRGRTLRPSKAMPMIALVQKHIHEASGSEVMGLV